MSTAIDYRTTDPARPSRGLHIAAVVTLCFTFPLIFLGGLVTSHGAGMSVPDWPNSYGYNMFLFPPRLWTGGILFEHTHRLLGTIVGFCAIVLTAVAWGPAGSGLGRRLILWTAGVVELLNAAGTAAMCVRRPAGEVVPHGLVTAAGIAAVAAVAWACRRREPRRWVRWMATACLIAVCAQGLLGGLRVDLINLPLAMVHGCFAQATFCLMVVTAVVTGRVWRKELPAEAVSPAGSVVSLAYLAGLVVFAQLIVAAVMRHSGAGLAIPDLPLAYGHLLPPVTADQLAVANEVRTHQLNLDPVSLGQVWLHFAHRCGAVVVSAVVIGLIVAIARGGQRALVRPAVAVGVLLATQVSLGLLTVYYRKPADVASAHVACGALVLATVVLIAARATRLYVLRRPPTAAAASVDAEPAGVLVAV